MNTGGALGCRESLHDTRAGFDSLAVHHGISAEMPYTHQPFPSEPLTDDQMREICDRAVRQFLRAQR